VLVNRAASRPARDYVLLPFVYLIFILKANGCISPPAAANICILIFAANAKRSLSAAGGFYARPCQPFSSFAD